MSSDLKPKDKKMEHAEDLARMSRILARRAEEAKLCNKGRPVPRLNVRKNTGLEHKSRPNAALPEALKSTSGS